jgi:hypothetical protein
MRKKKNYNDNDMRLNKRRKLGERKLLAKKPNSNVGRKRKPSRQDMLLARRPRHELRKMPDGVKLLTGLVHTIQNYAL